MLIVPAFSQDAQPGYELEEVIVTGSRIARTELESSTPVQVITSEQLQLQGVENLADILARLPAVGTAAISKANSNFNTSSNGVSTINLRNLDDKRSLVLINGRRVVSGVGGTTTVDLNNIPADLIESVQVMTGGASAVYGSEAIAGVVNIILKKDFEGISAGLQQGMTGKVDNNRTLASITAGAALGSAGHFVLNYQYDKDRGLHSRDRAISSVDQLTKSGYPSQGRFFSDNLDWTYDSSNNLIEWRDNNTDGYNRNGDRLISVPLQRHLLTGLLNVDFSDSLSGFVEVGYSKVKSSASQEPYASDNSDAHLPDGSQYAGLTSDNPFIPQAILDDLGPDSTLFMLKRLNGVFDRGNVAERDFHRIVTGLKGKWFDQLNWEGYIEQSQTREDNRSGTALRDRYFYALDAIADPDTGQPICRDAVARAEGCAPFNPFGFNSVSPEAIAYLTRNGTAFDLYRAKVSQQMAAFNMNASVWKLPAGDLQFAGGLEWRKEKSTEVYSPETQSGNTMGNALTNTLGQYSVKEAYLETLVPLVKDALFARSWDAEAAIRVGNYSTVGTVSNWKLGTTWAPVNSLRFRAVYASAARAPNITELYAGANQTYPVGLTDPCDGVDGTTPGGVAAWCRSIPGVADQINTNGVFQYDPNRDSESIQGNDLSNPKLNVEVAKTWTVGLVLTPAFLPEFNMTIDWYSIRIRDAISFLPRQTIIDECASSLGTSSYCSYITREPVGTARPRTPGTIYNIDTLPINAAEISTSGIDVGARYTLDLLPYIGQLELGLQYSYLDALNLKTSSAASVEKEKGQLSGDGRLGAGFPHRANLSATYKRGSISASWRLNYLSGMKDTLDANAPALDPALNRIGSYLYHDMQLRYSLGKDRQYSAYVGADNVFNKLPPFIPDTAGGASNVTGTNTAADSYDPIGRFIYAGVTARF